MKGRRLRREHGAAAVEFAIISVVLLSVVFGIIEFGILMYDQHVLTNASREGARAGVVMRVPRLSDLEIEAIVEKYAEEHMVTFGASNDPITEVTRSWLPLAPRFGDELEVTVRYTFDFLVLSIVGLGQYEFQVVTRMKLE